MRKYKKIEVVPYNPQWPQLFLMLKFWYSNALREWITDIQHVGSTSVVGLAAKPILDIDIIVEDWSNFDKITAALADLGYVHKGDLGITGRESFSYEGQFSKYEHNLYVCLNGCDSLENHLRFRDYLRQHPKVAEAYGQLKMDLATQFPNNIDLYVEHKTPFITNILTKAGFKESALTKIRQQNKADES